MLMLQMVTKFAWVQKCLTHWTKTIFFHENDTNEVKGSYHDDCIESFSKKKKKKKISY